MYQFATQAISTIEFLSLKKVGYGKFADILSLFYFIGTTCANLNKPTKNES